MTNTLKWSGRSEGTQHLLAETKGFPLRVTFCLPKPELVQSILNWLCGWGFSAHGEGKRAVVCAGEGSHASEAVCAGVCGKILAGTLQDKPLINDADDVCVYLLTH